MSEPKFVQCQWNDAYGDSTDEATHLNVHERHRPMVMETTGWLLLEDDHGLSIFNERCTDVEPYAYRSRTFIPKGMVKSVVEMKLVKPRKARVKAPTPTI